ncbi:MAG: hypothetical protein IJS08_14350 [Victivallales bacterium]|nr:hypothetical protein [Victivallales bacterium]
MPYCAKMKKLKSDPLWTLEKLFKSCAKNEHDRKVLAELLASGRISIYSSDGKRLLEGKMLEPVIKEVSTIFGQLNKFREANGDAVYESLESALRAAKWNISTKALVQLTTTDCVKLAKSAKDFNIDRFNLQWEKHQSFQAATTLKAFKEQIEEWFDNCQDEFATEDEEDPERLMQIRKQLFIALAIKQSEKLDAILKSVGDIREALVTTFNQGEAVAFFEPFLKVKEAAGEE